MSYAKVLGATSRQDGYLEGNGYLVSWCVGHLVELAPPNVYDAKYVKWNIADLPILPEKWQYLVSASTKKQFGILQKLMHRPDVDSIVNSCDSGREGELIFRLVYEQAGCKKPVSRLWLSSMEDNAIREGFQKLKPSTEYDALYNAALCRERADWMVGINASRLFSCLYGQPLAVGRVMTPVLAMTVVREAAIAAFTPEKFYTVDLELTSGCTASSRRIPEKSVAENLLKACRKEMVATIQRITRKEKSENPPSLYDLTTLQRDANRLLVDQSEDQFSLPSGIATVHNALDIRAVHQFLQDAKLLFGGRRHQILPLLRQDGQVCNAPLDVLGIVDVGWSQFYQVPYAPAYQIAVALKVAILTAGRTEDFGVGHSDGWLFRHD